MCTPSPFKFGWLIFVSLLMVLLALISYCIFSCKTRRHIGDGKPLLGSAPRQAQEPSEQHRTYGTDAKGSDDHEEQL